MQIVDFDKSCLEKAKRLVFENYDEERKRVPVLPGDAGLPPMDVLAENGLGVAAVEDGKLLGFLSAYGPFQPMFYTQDLRGVFSSVHAHAVQKEERIRIWHRLYQAAAEKWVNAGASSHAIALYAHDSEAQTAMYQYGFGMRCMDLIRNLSPVAAPEISGIAVREAHSLEVRLLRIALAEHLAQSPSFMRDDETVLQRWLDRKENSDDRVFAAYKNGKPIAYMEVCANGETFASYAPSMANICGAYCLPEERGAGVAQAVLNQVIRTLHDEGYQRLGVDCESFNPTAAAFWRKYFTPYTHSVVRRIDENALKKPQNHK